METETYLEHIWVTISKRSIKMIDSEGVDEIIKWKFDEEGAEGFYETIAEFNKTLPEDLITYLA